MTINQSLALALTHVEQALSVAKRSRVKAAYQAISDARYNNLVEAVRREQKIEWIHEAILSICSEAEGLGADSANGRLHQLSLCIGDSLDSGPGGCNVLAGPGSGEFPSPAA
jgi:hypothetical protein